MTTLIPIEPLLKIRPARTWEDLNPRELWHFRDLLLMLGIRDVKLRYRQTALGAVWAVLQPLLGAVISAVVFGRMAGFSSDGVPYMLFAFAGFLAWNGFQNTFSKTGSVLLENVQLVSKVYFPRIVLPLSTLCSSAVDFAVSLVLFLILFAIYRVPLRWEMLLLPVWFMGLNMLAMGIGLFLSAAAVTYRDVKHIMPVLLRILMFASPVMYGLSEVMKMSEKWQMLFLLNPLTAYLQAFRWSCFGSPMPWWTLWYSAGVTAGCLAVGAWYFAWCERKFADVI